MEGLAPFKELMLLGEQEHSGTIIWIILLEWHWI